MNFHPIWVNRLRNSDPSNCGDLQMPQPRNDTLNIKYIKSNKIFETWWIRLILIFEIPYTIGTTVKCM